MSKSQWTQHEASRTSARFYVPSEDLVSSLLRSLKSILTQLLIVFLLKPWTVPHILGWTCGACPVLSRASQLPRARSQELAHVLVLLLRRLLISYLLCIRRLIGEEKHVTYANLVHYLPYLRFESHVKHAVRFIQNQVGATAQVSLTTFQEVNKTSWSSDANLHA